MRRRWRPSPRRLPPPRCPATRWGPRPPGCGAEPRAAGGGALTPPGRTCTLAALTRVSIRRQETGPVDGITDETFQQLLPHRRQCCRLAAFLGQAVMPPTAMIMYHGIISSCIVKGRNPAAIRISTTTWRLQSPGRVQVVGRTLAEVAVAAGLQPSKGAARRLIKVPQPRASSPIFPATQPAGGAVLQRTQSQPSTPRQSSCGCLAGGGKP